MRSRFFLAGLVLAAVTPFIYYGGMHITRAYAQTSSGAWPAMTASTITFSEIESFNGNSEQHAVRVVAYRSDYSTSGTFYWTHENAPAAQDRSGGFDRLMELYRPDGYFRVEVLSDIQAKLTFPRVREAADRLILRHRDPRQDCLKDFRGTSALGPSEKTIGKQPFFLPGVGVLDAIMTSATDSAMTVTSWFAPSLGCAEVQHVATFPQKEGLGVNAMYPVAATLGEPKEELFSDHRFPETDPARVTRMRVAARAASGSSSHAEIQAAEDRAVLGAPARAKAQAYANMWSLFRAGKLK